MVCYQGGSNAGHTIINDYGKFALHLLPSGVFYPHITNVLGHGVALNLRVLLDGLAYLVGCSRSAAASSTNIGSRTGDLARPFICFHLLLDAYEEERLGSAQAIRPSSGYGGC